MGEEAARGTATLFSLQGGTRLITGGPLQMWRGAWPPKSAVIGAGGDSWGGQAGAGRAGAGVASVRWKLSVQRLTPDIHLFPSVPFFP